MNQLKANAIFFAFFISLFACSVTFALNEKVAKEETQESRDAKIRDEKLSFANFHKKIWERTRAVAQAVVDKFHRVIGNRFKAGEIVQAPVGTATTASTLQLVEPTERPQDAAKADLRTQDAQRRARIDDLRRREADAAISAVSNKEFKLYYLSKNLEDLKDIQDFFKRIKQNDVDKNAWRESFKEFISEYLKKPNLSHSESYALVQIYAELESTKK